jgi:FKBP-type peptidyl-prolyl cis-trans isomerase 2
MTKTLLFVTVAVIFSGRLAFGDGAAPTTQPVSGTPTTSPDIAAAGDTVAVHYTGKLEDGSVFDSSAGKSPLRFAVGAGQMIKGFDAAVRGMHVGDKKQVKLDPEDAYGRRDEDRLVKVPKERLGEMADKVKVGDKLAMRSGARAMPVVVTAVGEKEITIDANHPLAGKTLVFDIELVELGKRAEDRAQFGDTVWVEYAGRLEDGKEFDSTKAHGGEPMQFVLGVDPMIAGLAAAVTDMKVGQSKTAKIPPEQAYGERGSPPAVPANATLIFDIKLVKLQKRGANRDTGE